VRLNPEDRENAQVRSGSQLAQRPLERLRHKEATMRRASKYLSRLAPLAVAAALIASPAAAQQVDVKGEKELTAAGKKVDKDGASADSGRVTGKIVEQWKGTEFKFDTTSAPRELTAQDVQNLRQKGLGFGEISILLALTAKQPDPATALPLSEILARRQAGEGWGKLAKSLGYPNLGSVMKSVKATEKTVEKTAADGKAEKVSKVDKTEKVDKPDKPEKVDKVEKPERIRVEKPERVEKPGR